MAEAGKTVRKTKAADAQPMVGDGSVDRGDPCFLKCHDERINEYVRKEVNS
jgi:hypothetical protein